MRGGGCRSAGRAGSAARTRRCDRGPRSCLEEELARTEPAVEVLHDRGRIRADELVGDATRGLDQVRVLLQVGEAQKRRPALARAEVFARAALEQVLARDLEAVVAL